LCIIYDWRFGPGVLSGFARGRTTRLILSSVSTHTLAQFLLACGGTRAVMAGIDLPTLAALLGRTSIQMTMRYVRPAEEHKRAAAGKFERYKATEAMNVAARSQHYLQFPLL
jgi:hypothetical protein